MTYNSTTKTIIAIREFIFLPLNLSYTKMNVFFWLKTKCNFKKIKIMPKFAVDFLFVTEIFFLKQAVFCCCLLWNLCRVFEAFLPFILKSCIVYLFKAHFTTKILFFFIKLNFILFEQTCFCYTQILLKKRRFILFVFYFCFQILKTVFPWRNKWQTAAKTK